MKEKFVACFIAGAMALSMAACGDNGRLASDPVLSRVETEQAENAPESTPTPEPEEQVPVAEEQGSVAEDASIDFEDENKELQLNVHDANLLYVNNEIELEEYAGLRATGWARIGVRLTDEQKALLVPGSVLTINYNCPDSIWLVVTAKNDNPNPLGNFLRAVDQDTFVVDGYVASDNSCVQYTYEQLEEYWGENFPQYIDYLWCESKSDWEVSSLTVGMTE